jgi:hypothetical protein
VKALPRRLPTKSWNSPPPNTGSRARNENRASRPVFYLQLVANDMALKDDILTLLTTDRLSVTQVHDEFPQYARSSVGEAVERLHAAKLVYIAGWKAGRKTPLYKTGTREDHPRPRPLTAAARQRRYREAHEAEIRMKRAAKRAPRSDDPRGQHPVGQHWMQLLQQ